MKDVIKGPPLGWLRQRLEKLRRLFKKCRAENYDRSWYLDYVLAVNRLHWEIESRGSSKRRFYAQIEKENGRSGRKGRHPLLTILAATTSSLDPRILSRWSRALQYANKKRPGATNSELRQFLQRPGKGGMAGREKKLAKPRKRSSPVISKRSSKARLKPYA